MCTRPSLEIVIRHVLLRPLLARHIVLEAGLLVLRKLVLRSPHRQLRFARVHGRQLGLQPRRHGRAVRLGQGNRLRILLRVALRLGSQNLSQFRVHLAAVGRGRQPLQSLLRGQRAVGGELRSPGRVGGLLLRSDCVGHGSSFGRIRRLLLLQEQLVRHPHRRGPWRRGQQRGEGRRTGRAPQAQEQQPSGIRGLQQKAHYYRA